jgi:hypothetical protein
MKKLMALLLVTIMILGAFGSIGTLALDNASLSVIVAGTSAEFSWGGPDDGNEYFLACARLNDDGRYDVMIHYAGAMTSFGRAFVLRGLPTGSYITFLFYIDAEKTYYHVLDDATHFTVGQPDTVHTIDENDALQAITEKMTGIAGIILGIPPAAETTAQDIVDAYIAGRIDYDDALFMLMLIDEEGIYAFDEMEGFYDAINAVRISRIVNERSGDVVYLNTLEHLGLVSHNTYTGFYVWDIQNDRDNVGNRYDNVLSFQVHSFSGNPPGHMRLEYFLNREYELFTGNFFLHNESKDLTQIHNLEIYADDDLVVKIEGFTVGSLPQSFEADVTNAQKLIIIVRAGHTMHSTVKLGIGNPALHR